MSSTPTAQTAIDILERLKGNVGSATLAYWITPNSILTLSGARAYCDASSITPARNSLQNGQPRWLNP